MVHDMYRRAGVELGLLNYYFGNKDKLIELCVERTINGIVEQLQNMRERTFSL